MAALVFVLATLLLPLQISYCVLAQQNVSKKLYVAYLGEKQYEDPVGSIIYSYKHGFSGFAAMLTELQAEKLAELPEVRSIKPSIAHPLQTTHSQDFLGLDYTKPTGLLHDSKYGDGVIIGIVDSGIWPESASFSDHGLRPVPSKWKGTCQTGKAFRSNQCNRKIIGARWYDKHLSPEDLKGEYRSARDSHGHGTHVASTAAGALVPNISFHGLAAGCARGVAPRARIAVYKACWGTGCHDASILKAFDDAIHDGVDVLSLSIGKSGAEFEGSLDAMKNGITVVFAAGNEGPAPRTVTNASPWSISVASATIDRAFPTLITLDNSTTSIVGQSLFYEPKDNNNLYEIYLSSCLIKSGEKINATLASGKIVVCYSPDSVSITSPRDYLSLAVLAAKEAGAKGIIFATYALDILDYFVNCGEMPCVFVDFDVVGQMSSVVKVAPARTWIGGEVLAPKISTFSSRGPSPLYPQFLKPDVAAPGSNILAAFEDSYKFMSGTSMACPHVSGVAALLKALHPDWSPAIIKSAIVTTASNDRFGLPIFANGLPQKIADPFDYGGGFIDPNRAVDPGLAYDISHKEFNASFDCGSSCESVLQNLNLPSIAIPNLTAATTVLRTVTNVGQADAVYKAVVQSPPGVRISVEPSVLKFRQGKKKRSFKITFSMAHKVQGGYLFGSLAWCDGGSHYVRIPIAVRPVPPPMASIIFLLATLLLLPLQTSYCVVAQQNNASKKLYVAYLGEKKYEDPEKTTASHHDMLTRILGRQTISFTIFINHTMLKHEHRSVQRRSSWFDYLQLQAWILWVRRNAHRTPSEKTCSIKPSIAHPLQTTHSQDFLGLDYTKPTGLLHDSKYGDGVIIGIVDTGIWPESASFSDHGLGPVPSKWKGKCQAGKAFSSNQCNRKIIGARWYDKHLSPEDLKGEYRSARDSNGHGTHVASTAAGALVPNISFHGLAAGCARGVAPRARIAVYKACWGTGCHDASILQAFDDAIHDGVDVLSLSIGKSGAEFEGSLDAMKNGITVVFAAGNEGPAPRTVTNASPWSISVASGTIDRAFPTLITLANSTTSIVGQSLFYDPKDNNNWYEIYVSSCLIKSGVKINATLASGKIVVCYSPASVSITSPHDYLSLVVLAAKEAGAKGIIFATYALDILDYFVNCGEMPCVFVDFDVVGLLSSVVKVSPARTWVGREVLAPKISTFSSRGPSPLFPQFLKPDVAAPGSNILAAFEDSYKFMSGTSMACPHVSGVAALLKALHPDWSPAIIKSAIVTTASNDRYGLPIFANGLPQKIADPFDYGGGFIDPNKAVDPGLSYDISHKEFNSSLDCGSNCESVLRNLNLPSIAIPNLTAPTTVLRTVTNVGQADAVYKAVVQSPPGVRISVEPSVLKFRQGKKKQSFKVTFSMTDMVQGDYLFGSLTWCDGGAHNVRIPIAVRPVHKTELQTTRSQDFLGLDFTNPTGLLHDAKYGDGVIIGIVDTGIWPESKSFSDDGLGPVPSKWKGTCQAGQNFSSNHCNRKIIGARWYDEHLTAKDLESDYRSARDAGVHGTHVASTAAGALVPNVSFHGLAAGYARGAAPRARLQVYKACWGLEAKCHDASVLQAIDHARHDGVDVLSLSIVGGNEEYYIRQKEYYSSLQAVNHSITVVFGTGNDGPAPRTVRNAPPRATSVASATIDRAFPTPITFANSTRNFVVHGSVYGQSFFRKFDDKDDSWYEVYHSSCLFGTPQTSNVTLAAGKIVLCYTPASSSIIVAACHVAQQIKESVDKNTALVVKVSSARTWIGGEVLAPKISTFSSRGPSPLWPEFLKPDIAAPGSNIMAAYGDFYVFLSGTSMACPHVSGVAALLKALHPDWSPAIIKSAIVTTASNEKYGLPILADGLPQKIADPFDYGGGFIDPIRAVDPGLAYDLSNNVNPKDYISLDCQFANSSCDYKYLNLPSIAIPNLTAPTTVLRTVTNVGQADAVYKAVVQSPPGVRISVEPSVLRFRQDKKKQSFKVTFSMTHKVQGSYLFESLAWYDGGAHYVRIPIAVRPVVSDNYADV
uniref:Uncharacterized protein n=1 Tax=Leersia perrieri TaxID=77586 RepID=A0A0D9W1X7_9ORYZ